jgi:hypothetical protein
MATQPARALPLPEPGVPAKAPRLSIVAGSALIVLFQTGCAIIVFANRISLIIGGAALGLTAHASWMHSDPVRLPLLALATAGSVFNLFLLWNARRLRRRPAARWRIRPLRLRDKLRDGLVLAVSLVTLFMVISELVLHPGIYPGGH